MAEYAPISVRDLMLAVDAPAGLANELGSGNDSRIYPVQMSEGAVYPACVYTELDEIPTLSKDGGDITAWSFMLIVMAENYLTAQKIARLSRKAINQKTIEVDDVGTLLLQYQGKEDLNFEDNKDIYQTALTFRATKTL